MGICLGICQSGCVSPQYIKGPSDQTPPLGLKAPAEDVAQSGTLIGLAPGFDLKGFSPLKNVVQPAYYKLEPEASFHLNAPVARARGHHQFLLRMFLSEPSQLNRQCFCMTKAKQRRMGRGFQGICYGIHRLANVDQHRISILVLKEFAGIAHVGNPTLMRIPGEREAQRGRFLRNVMGAGKPAMIRRPGQRGRLHLGAMLGQA